MTNGRHGEPECHQNACLCEESGSDVTEVEAASRTAARVGTSVGNDSSVRSRSLPWLTGVFACDAGSKMTTHHSYQHWSTPG